MTTNDARPEWLRGQTIEIDALDRAKLGGIQDAFDFVGHVPEDLRPLSREGTGARCRRALPGNPDDIRVNHQTWIDVMGRRAGSRPAATRSLSLAQPVEDGATHAETPAVSAYHWPGRMRG